MNNFQRTAAWLHACGKEQTPHNVSIQIGCHIEEFVEFLDCIHINIGTDTKQSVMLALTDLAKGLKAGGIWYASIPYGRRADALDALCDMEVTGNGVAYLADMEKDEADKAVLASNEAKLVDGKPVILPGGKIGKPEGWKAPNLNIYV
jgi:predicted HAD superfamily Cof-like phosphohydrolase